MKNNNKDNISGFLFSNDAFQKINSKTLSNRIDISRQSSLNSFRKRPFMIVSIILVISIYLASIIFSAINDFDFKSIDNAVLNFDSENNNIWANIWIGTLITMSAGIILGIIVVIISLAFGAYLAYYDNYFARFLLSLVKSIESFPRIILIMIITGLFRLNYYSLLFGILFTTWTRGVVSFKRHFNKYYDVDFVKNYLDNGGSIIGAFVKQILPEVSWLIGSILISNASNIILWETSFIAIASYLNVDIHNLGSAIYTGLNIYSENPNKIIAVLLPSLIFFTISISFYGISVGFAGILRERTNNEQFKL